MMLEMRIMEHEEMHKASQAVKALKKALSVVVQGASVGSQISDEETSRMQETEVPLNIKQTERARSRKFCG